MSERGFIAVDRGLFDHPVFAPEPYTEREAWLWLIAEAAWKPTTVRVGRAIVKVGRGELAYSLRFMATKWRWSEPRVRRFLDKLSGRRTGDALVLVQATRDSTHITICNYDRYQDVRRTRDAQTDAPPDAKPTQRRTTNQKPVEEDPSETTFLQESPGSDEPDPVAEKKPKKSKAYSQDFEQRFWLPYPRTPTMSKHEAWQVWQRISQDERTAAMAAVGKYAEWLREDATRPVQHACRFLSKRRAEGFLDQPQVVNGSGPLVCVPHDDPVCRFGRKRWANIHGGEAPREDLAGVWLPASWVDDIRIHVAQLQRLSA